MVKKILCRVIRSAPLGENDDTPRDEHFLRIGIEDIYPSVVYTSRFAAVQLLLNETPAGRIVDYYA